MFFRSFLVRVIFLGFFVCGLQSSSILNAQASALEQAFLCGFGFASRWGAHHVGSIAQNITTQAIPQEVKDSLYALSEEITENAHAAIDNAAKVMGSEEEQKIAVILKALFEGAKNLVIDLTPNLASLNLAIFLWTLGLFAYEQARAKITGAKLPFEVEGVPLAKLLRLIHLCGMDLYWVWITLGSFNAALMALAPVTEDIQQQALAGGMFFAGVLIGYVSFNLMSVPLAGAITKSWAEKTFFQRLLKNFAFVTTVFDVGIIIAASSSRILFELGEATGLLEGCRACKATYQFGEDSAYVISDVFSNLRNWRGTRLDMEIHDEVGKRVTSQDYRDKIYDPKPKKD